MSEYKQKYMKNFKVIKFKKKTKKLIFFLNKITEKEFQINKSFKNSPWIHINDSKFSFYRFEINKKIIGLSAVIKLKINYHLQFFYISKNFRSLGYGKKILEKILPKKKFTTVHVPYTLSRRTQKFYIKNKFKLSNLKEKNSKLKYWILRCRKFDKKTFIEKKLLYRNLI